MKPGVQRHNHLADLNVSNEALYQYIFACINLFSLQQQKKL